MFALELVRRLAETAPNTDFVLLTQAASHDELGALDCANVRRVMVVGSSLRGSLQVRKDGALARSLRYFPDLARRAAARAASVAYRALKRYQDRARRRGLGADLLFCPFTAPTYSDKRVPIVCTIYDLQYKTYPEFFAPEDVTHRERAFLSACRHATRLVAISDYSRESAILHGKLQPDRICTIHIRMAQRIAGQRNAIAPVLSRLSLGADQYLLYPANFWKHKNHEMLLTGFGMACAGGLPGHVKLVCSGAPGERRDWLMRASAGLGLESRVVFPGYLSDAELSVLLANARGVVFPSLYEGFGLPVVEAMAAGIPVACSNLTSLPEVAGDAAILFDPKMPGGIAQAILSLVLDQSVRDRCILEGRARAAGFSDSDRMAREYWSVFHAAIAAHETMNRSGKAGA